LRESFGGDRRKPHVRGEGRKSYLIRPRGSSGRFLAVLAVAVIINPIERANSIEVEPAVCGKRIAEHLHLSTEFGTVPGALLENVFVFGPAPYINPDDSNFAGCDDFQIDHVSLTSPFLSRPGRQSGKWRGGGEIWIIETLVNRTNEPLPIYVVPLVASVRITGVLPHRKELPPAYVPLRAGVEHASPGHLVEAYSRAVFSNTIVTHPAVHAYLQEAHQEQADGDANQSTRGPQRENIRTPHTTAIRFQPLFALFCGILCAVIGFGIQAALCQYGEGAGWRNTAMWCLGAVLFCAGPIVFSVLRLWGA